jgi:hypothetical protein
MTLQNIDKKIIYKINKIDLITGKLIETCEWYFKEDAYKDFDDKSESMICNMVMVLIKDDGKNKKIISERRRL